MGAQRQQLSGVFDGHAQVEVENLQLNPVCLDLGEIEDVINDSQKGFTA